MVADEAAQVVVGGSGMDLAQGVHHVHVGVRADGADGLVGHVVQAASPCSPAQLAEHLEGEWPAVLHVEGWYPDPAAVDLVPPVHGDVGVVSVVRLWHRDL